MNQSQLFHDFIVNEVWADHCEPNPNGGVVLHFSEHYDEFHNAYETAEFCGAKQVRTTETDELDGPATVFQFPDQSTITIADDGGAMLPNTGGAERVLFITNDAHNAIMGAHNTRNPWHDTGFQTPSDQWLVPVTNEVMDRLGQLRMDDEALSDVIIRMFMFYQTGRHTQA